MISSLRPACFHSVVGRLTRTAAMDSGCVYERAHCGSHAVACLHSSIRENFRRLEATSHSLRIPKRRETAEETIPVLMTTAMDSKLYEKNDGNHIDRRTETAAKGAPLKPKTKCLPDSPEDIQDKSSLLRRVGGKGGMGAIRIVPNATTMKTKIRRAMSQIKPPRSTRYHLTRSLQPPYCLSPHTVAWICDSSRVYTAARALLDRVYQMPTHQSGADQYTLGSIGTLNIMLVVHVSARLHSVSMKPDFEMNLPSGFPPALFSLNVGLGKGSPGKDAEIRPGDIVVSAPKSIGDNRRYRDDSTNPSRRLLRRAVRGLYEKYKGCEKYEDCGYRLEQKLNDLFKKKPQLRQQFKRPGSDWQGSGQNNRPDTSSPIAPKESAKSQSWPEVHYGRVALMDSNLDQGHIIEAGLQKANVLCAAVDTAAKFQGLECLTIRGISEHWNSGTNDSWKDYAAMTASLYAKELLLHMVESEPGKSSSAISSLQLAMGK